MTIALRGIQYVRRVVAKAFDADFWTQELQFIQRAIPPYLMRSLTVSTTQLPNDRYILMDATSGAKSVTLLPPSQWGSFPLSVKKTDASGNAVTLVGTIDGAVNPTLGAQYVTREIVSDGTNLWFVSRNL